MVVEMKRKKRRAGDDESEGGGIDRKVWVLMVMVVGRRQWVLRISEEGAGWRE